VAVGSFEQQLAGLPYSFEFIYLPDMSALLLLPLSQPI
jgi:hypothetical protein